MDAELVHSVEQRLLEVTKSRLFLEESFKSIQSSGLNDVEMLHNVGCSVLEKVTCTFRAAAPHGKHSKSAIAGDDLDLRTSSVLVCLGSNYYVELPLGEAIEHLQKLEKITLQKLEQLTLVAQTHARTHTISHSS